MPTRLASRLVLFFALHGFPLDHRLFDPLAAAAERGEMGDGVRVLAPDFRGRGLSELPALDTHTMEILADDVARAIEDVGGSDPIVAMGVSMGGYVLFELLRRHGARLRDRLRGLVLSGTRATEDSATARAGRLTTSSSLRTSGIGILSGFHERLLAKASHGTEVERLTKAMIEETPPLTAAADLLGMAARRESFDVLGTFSGAVLIVAGEDDRVIPIDEAEAMAEAASNASFVRLLTLPGVGHLAPLEAPGEVALACRDLIARVRPAC